MNKIKSLFGCVVLLLTLYTEGVAQVAINTDGSAPSANTILDLNPAVGKAFLPPTMTWAQIKAIVPPKAGMVVYDSDFNCLRLYNGTKWVSIGEQASLFTPPGSFMTQSASGNITPKSVATDATGNVYVTGSFTGTATFGALTITAVGSSDIFIVKYNNSGTAIWVQKAGGSLNDESTGIALDASGNVYITGIFQGTATFGGLTSIVASGTTDSFVAKYNSSGTAIWVQKAGGYDSNHYTNAKSVVLDVSGNIYITGSFRGTATFGSLTAITAMQSFSDSDIFVAKYDNSGAAIWVQKAGGASADTSNDIAIDASGNVYVTGFIQSTASFGALTIAAGASSAAFVAKYNNSGIPIWVQKAGGLGTDFAESTSIALDASNNVYVTGYFSGTANFGTLPSINSGSGLSDFVAKYDNSGTALWVKKTVSNTSSSFSNITVDFSGNVYVTGYFSGTATLGTLAPLVSAGNYDIYLAKYNNTGTEQWAQRMGGADNDYGNSITVDAIGNIYTVGTFTPSAQFGNQVLTSGSMFLMKYVE